MGAKTKPIVAKNTKYHNNIDGKHIVVKTVYLFSRKSIFYHEFTFGTSKFLKKSRINRFSFLYRIFDAFFIEKLI